MYHRIVSFLIVIIVLWSCKQPTQGTLEEDVIILFPATNAIYEEESPITLIANRSVQWFSSLNGFLGEGKRIIAKLQAGEHTIHAQTENLERRIHISVHPFQYASNTWRTILINQAQEKYTLPAGTYIPLLCGGERNVTLSFSFNTIIRNVYPKPRYTYNTIQTSTEPPFRDTYVKIPAEILIATQNLRKAKGLTNNILLQQTGDPIQIGSIRTFHMANPEKGTSEPGWSVESRCVALSEKIALWIDTNDNSNDSEVQNFFNTITTQIIPRVKSIIGTHQDPDDDGLFHIIMSSKLNKQRLAIGFFNPCDFFPYNDDTTNNAYNPTSNEMDIIYCGLIDAADQAYSRKSILATVAHEYQHLVRFSRKTYVRFLHGETNPPIEDSAFDEAASHLMENLVGYGISGGNIRFVEQYLSNTGDISLFGADRNGATDSAGKRGMGALFLAWLMEEAGGFLLEGTNLTDNGGLSFYRKSIDYAGTGWSYIETSLDQSIDSLLYSFGQMLVSFPYLAEKPLEIMFDPLTGEPLTLHPYLGNLENPYQPGQSYILQGPSAVLMTDSYTLIPHSCVVLTSWHIQEPIRVTFSQIRPYSTYIFGFFMGDT
ncbi:MAG TPA: hypothetical protein PLW34_06680 [Termitinemataceae bacterium]|nr:hypothetical protein [Termitinemataceae bacterium]HPQ01008.1 hypothetical protein [Termitinemataceae bacterium]